MGHVVFGSDRDAHVRGPRLPDSAYVHFLSRHGLHDFLARTSGLQHELVANRRDVFEAVLVEEGEHIFAHVLNDLAALGNHVGCLQAGDRSHNAGNRQGARAVRHNLFQQVGTAHSRARAQPCHSIQLRESAQNDDVLILSYQVGAHGRPRDVDIGFIHHEHAPLRFVLQQPLDVGAGRQRSRGVIRITDVDQSRVGVGFGHGLHVVGVSLGQGHAGYFRADEPRRAFARLIPRIGRYERLGGRAETQHGLVKRRAGTAVWEHVIRLEALLLGQQFLEAEGFLVQIPAALRGHGVDRL